MIADGQGIASPHCHVLCTDRGDSGDPNSTLDFNALWIQEFKKTNAYEVWERVTDPMLFDIVEARYAWFCINIVLLCLTCIQTPM